MYCPCDRVRHLILSPEYNTLRCWNAWPVGCVARRNRTSFAGGKHGNTRRRVKYHSSSVWRLHRAVEGIPYPYSVYVGDVVSYAPVHSFLDRTDHRGTCRSDGLEEAMKRVCGARSEMGGGLVSQLLPVIHPDGSDVFVWCCDVLCLSCGLVVAT